MAAAPRKQMAENLDSDPAPAPSSADAIDAEADNAVAASSTEPTAKRDTGNQLEQCRADIEKLSHKNTTALMEARKTLNRLKKRIGESETELSARCQALQQTLSELLEKNRGYQDEVEKATGELIESLKQSLEAGQSHEALPTWDRIQGNISNTSGKVRSALQKQANQYKTKLNELRDWKSFAATEKKKELINQMQVVTETKMDPASRSKRIGKLHKEWKALGQSDQNESLWKKFKALSDKAYEPCKDYFRKRKQLKAENLKARLAVTRELETQLASLDKDNINIAQVSQLLSEADKAWKHHAPVEQGKIKSLQKQYYGLINQLRKIRKAAIRDNAAAKQALIEQARELTTEDDQQAAMQAAKKLQREWQQIGPTTFKEDKKLWAEFRIQCDKIFARRRQQAAELKDQLGAVEKKLETILVELEKLLSLDDAGLREARSHYRALLQDFSAALDPKLRQSRARFMDRCNDLKRRIQARLQALPDKKQQALQTAIKERCDRLENIECTALKATSAEQCQAALAALDKDKPEFMATTGHADCDAILAERCRKLQEHDSVPALQQAVESAEHQFRDLCIELEIRGDLESPAEDRARRMELQLAQLQQEFGQQKPDRKANIEFAREAELKALCIGPLDSGRRQKLTTRLQNATQKLR